MLSRNQSTAICFRPFAMIQTSHISIQVCTFHDGCKQGIDHYLSIYISVNIIFKNHYMLIVKNIWIIIKYCVIRNIRDTSCSTVGMLKGYMDDSKRKAGNSWASAIVAMQFHAGMNTRATQSELYPSLSCCAC